MWGFLEPGFWGESVAGVSGVVGAFGFWLGVGCAGVVCLLGVVYVCPCVRAACAPRFLLRCVFFSWGIFFVV